eukprot:CAMPEP_0119120878 /NCGR_PEP_ID=MMETSP1310-20130426/1741_1 /TAXON_ID=464262 /ORGANISM="Genus nov. species nov., Strain RCC2339" /LENGTH=1192 /DNA_ID=CAMNT_0007110389 /DNA_START=37 /DNA_END=3616 /DNA_ORIENTATION=+
MDNLAVEGTVIEKERLALEELYYNTEGENWVANTGWMSDEHACFWYGVVCNNASSVAALNLPVNHLVGPIPASLSNLQGLRVLQLGSNTLNGALPSSLGDLSLLEVLDVSKNELSHAIPTELGQLQSIMIIDLIENDFFGNIPSEFGLLSSLTFLSICVNPISGPIPEELFNLPALEELYLFENSLSGTISSNIGRLTRVTEMSLHGNFLTGTLPPELGSMKRLRRLGLYGNEFTGSLPNTLGNLEKMEELFVDHNKLSGTIPTTLGQLPHFYTLDCNHNSLTGTIPSELARLSMLKNLYCDSNELSGALPEELGDAHMLEVINLSLNKLTSIPDTLGNLSKLFILYLDQNDIVGTLPDLSGCTSLEYLSLSDNRLSGSIQPGYLALPGIKWMNLALNQFVGVLPDLSPLSEVVFLSLGSNFFDSTIPESYGRLTRLSYLLHLGNNSLVGTLPAALGNLTALEILIVTDNSLEGAIPTEVGGMVSLQRLYAEKNQFTLAPDELALPNLKRLRLGENQLAGTMPDLSSAESAIDIRFDSNQLVGTLFNFSRLTRLKNFFCNGNQLEGPLPEIPTARLEDLRLNNNAFSSTIPSTYGLLSKLETLDLANNAIFGTIPPELGLLGKLRNLALQGNQLSSTIPEEIFSIRSLWHLTLGNNKLTGYLALSEPLDSLLQLDITSNMLSGSLPRNLSRLLPILVEVNFSNNRLEGLLADLLPLPESLAALSVTGNSVAGTIPRDILSHPSMIVFRAGDNDLSGSLQVEINPGLRIVQVEENRLSGPLDEAVCLLERFTGEGNAFSCKLPECCGHGSISCGSCVGLARFWWWIMGGSLAILLLVIMFAVAGLRLGRDMGSRTAYQDIQKDFVPIGDLYLADIVLGEVAGIGQGGFVRHGMWQETTPVALKVLKDTTLSGVLTFEEEALALQSARHPHCVQFLGLYYGEDERGVTEKFIVTEWMDGSLLSFLRNGWSGLTQNLLKIVTRQIAAGVHYLHHRNVIHRDISCRNVLIRHLHDGLVAKLGDFGMARVLDDSGQIRGSPYVALAWAAPEVLSEQVFSKQSDVFSFGVTVWEMFSGGESPWKGVDGPHVARRVLRGEIVPKLPIMDELIYDQIIAECCAFRQFERPTLRQVYKSSALRTTGKKLCDTNGVLYTKLAALPPSVNSNDTSVNTSGSIGEIDNGDIYVYVSELWADLGR